MGEHRALGPAGRAGGEQDHCRVVQAHLDVAAHRPAGSKEVLVAARMPHDDHPAHVGTVRTLAAQVLEGFGDDEELGAAGVQRVLHLRWRQPSVEGDEDGPEQPAGEQRLDERGVVLPEVGHPVPAAYAALRQRIGEPVGAVGELGIAEASLTGDQCRALPGTQPPAGQPCPHSLVHR